MKPSPWVARFNFAWTDAELDRLVEIRAVPIMLGANDAHDDAQSLRAALKRVFLSGRQVRKVLRYLFSIARSHAVEHFGTEDTYRSGLYSAYPWVKDPAPAICFTGLAGVGKTMLLALFARLLGSPTSLDIGGIQGIPVVSAWPMSVRDGTDLNSLLGPYLSTRYNSGELQSGDILAAEIKDKSRIKGSNLLKLSRRRSWRDGVCLIPVDEFQFVTQSSEANARATALLLKLFGLGPRLLFCANYSLVHKLLMRNQEERQRLLSEPLILEQERSSSEEWIALLAEYKKVAPGVLTFDVREVADLIHSYTFGIKRMVVELLVCAYELARSKGKKTTVGPDEIRRAYLSAKYTANREDVDILTRQSIMGKRLRDDLWCPFDQSQDNDNVMTAQAAIDNYEARIEDALLDSALLPGEAAAVRSMEPFLKSDAPVGKVLRLPRVPVTKQSLLDACRVFDE